MTKVWPDPGNVFGWYETVKTDVSTNALYGLRLYVDIYLLHLLYMCRVVQMDKRY